MKKCTRCNESKPLNEFHNCQSKPDGKFSACKLCRNSAYKKYADKIGQDVIYQRNAKSPGYQEKRKERYQKNKEKVKASSRAWCEANKERKRANRKADYDKNRDRYIEQAAQWANENPEKRKEICAKHSRNARLDPEKKPVFTARSLLARVLSATGVKKRGKTFKVLGYNKDEFVAHIEKQFVDGMSWSNHGEWHVDHIISVSEMVKLGITSPKKINALSNLRPMWAKDNLSKGAGFGLAIQVGS